MLTLGISMISKRLNILKTTPNVYTFPKHPSSEKNGWGRGPFNSDGEYQTYLDSIPGHLGDLFIWSNGTGLDAFNQLGDDADKRKTISLHLLVDYQDFDNLQYDVFGYPMWAKFAVGYFNAHDGKPCAPTWNHWVNPERTLTMLPNDVLKKVLSFDLLSDNLQKFAAECNRRIRGA